MRKRLFLLSFCLFTTAPAVLATTSLGPTQRLSDTDGSQRECALMAARRVPAEVQRNQDQPLRNATPQGVRQADSAVDYVEN